MNYVSTGHVTFESVSSDGEWWWTLPDVLWMGHVRECAQPSTLLKKVLSIIFPKVTGCPAVLRFGNIENPTYSDPVPLTKKCQLLLGDLLAFSEFGRRADELDRTERDVIGKAFRNVYGDHLWGCNNSGYNDHPRADFFNNIDTDKDLPAFDAVRGFATNSYQGALIGNMVQIQTFDWYNLPQDYGVEILDHPAVQFCSIQYRGGAVGKFPYLTHDVPTALITKAPVFYYAERMQRYEGARRAPYWKP